MVNRPAAEYAESIQNLVLKTKWVVNEQDDYVEK